MFNLTIIVIGKLKESYWQNAEAEYLKRLKPYAKIKIKEIKEEAFSNINEKEKIKLIEAEKIKSLINHSQIIVALDENGQQYSSEEFARFLNDNSSQGENITFIIGGPLGLHESILKIYRHKLSLSKMTFTHQMVRVFLLEQIYRASTILNNKQYHY